MVHNFLKPDFTINGKTFLKPSYVREEIFLKVGQAFSPSTEAILGIVSVAHYNFVRDELKSSMTQEEIGWLDSSGLIRALNLPEREEDGDL